MRNHRLLVLDGTDDLATQVKRVAAGLRPRPEVVWCSDFSGAHTAIAESGSFDVMIAGPLVSKDAGLQELRLLCGQFPGMRLVLAVDRWRSTSLRDTVRTGALDILRLPVTDDSLLESIEQVIDMVRSDPPSPPGEVGAPDGKGTVIAVVSASGGCGKTFFATSLAYHLQSTLRKRTCLVDLDLQFGELATALRLKPKHTITDLAGSDDTDQDDLAKRFEEYLEHHDSGIALLAGPDEPADADAIEGRDVSRVIDAARARFDHVIIDTPAALSEAVMVTLEQADQIFAVATLDLPSVRNLGVMLATLKKLKVPSERVKLLLNKVEPDVGMDIARVEQYFPQGFAMTIPYGREVNRSLNMGQPVLAYAPRGDVSKALAAGLRSVSIAGTDADGGGGRDVSRRRFTDRFKKTA
jgi:pilus assembly protein CpaE